MGAGVAVAELGRLLSRPGFSVELTDVWISRVRSRYALSAVKM
jgi:hypothetical protein